MPHLSTCMLAAAVAVAPSVVSQKPDGREPAFDLPYVDSIATADPRRLDIYPTPSGEHRQPVVLYLHGGGWSGGDRKRVHRKPSWFAAEGVVLVSAGYRLVPDGAHPANVTDVAAAIAWVRRRIGDWGGDPERLFVMGHSSGGHLAALVATDERYLGAHGLSPAALAGVLVIDSDAFDLERRIRSLPAGQRQLYLAAFGSHPVGWRDASPAAHLVDDLPPPPFLVLEAGSDRWRQRQTAAFLRRLEGAGAAVRHQRFPAETHGSIIARMGRVGHPPGEAVLQFVREFDRR